MESQIRIVLLIVGAIIIAAIFVDGIRRQRKQRKISDANLDHHDDNSDEPYVRQIIDHHSDPADVAVKEFPPVMGSPDVVAETQEETVAEFDEDRPDASLDHDRDEAEPGAAQAEINDTVFEGLDGQPDDMSDESDTDIIEAASDVNTRPENDGTTFAEQDVEPEMDVEKPDLNVEEHLQAVETVEESPTDADQQRIAESEAREPNFDHVEFDTQFDAVEESADDVDAPAEIPEDAPPVNQAKPQNQLIMFSLVAQEYKTLGGFNLLQVLMKNNFHFGDMNLFHYHQDNDQCKKTLFSLAAATETGEFDISNMANFSAKGLVVFMHTQEHDFPKNIFNQMIKVTEQLAENLQAELRIGRDEKWTMSALEQLSPER